MASPGQPMYFPLWGKSSYKCYIDASFIFDLVLLSNAFLADVEIFDS